MKTKNTILISACFVLFCAVSASAQQKGQWVPGQFGLNAGAIPDPGITYANLVVNYSASRLNDSNGNEILQNVTGTYAFWADENVIYYVPKHKILGGYFMPYISINVANGSLVADLNPTNLGVSGGGAGFADTFVQPVNMGWHLKRTDFTVGYAFVAPTGRYSAGATNNVGSGYWGNDIISGTTFYITKNKATSANLTTAWEIHGQKTVASTPAGQLSKITPGQTFTDEWGLGQILPLEFQPARSIRSRRLRPVAGFERRRQLFVGRNPCFRQRSALLLRACRRRSGELHSSGKESAFLLQVLR